MPLPMERHSVHRREPEPGLLDSLLGGDGDGILAPILDPGKGGGQTTTTATSNPPSSPPPSPTPTTTNTPKPVPTQAPTTTTQGGGAPPSTEPQQAPPQSTAGGQTQTPTSTVGNDGSNAPDTPSSPDQGASSNPTTIGGLSEGVGNAAEGPDGNGNNSKGNTQGSSSDDKPTTTNGVPNSHNGGTETNSIAAPGTSGSNSPLLPGQTNSDNPNAGGVSVTAPTSSGSSEKAKAGTVNGGVVGGVVAAILVAVGLVFVFVYFLRKRQKQRQHERRVTWMTGTIDPPDMAQRGSMRSSWGTPVERRVSEVAPWVSPPPSTEGHENPFASSNFVVPPSAPVLPTPVVSVTRARSPENPFSDASASPQPVKRLSSLPIRISLLSTGSSSQNLDPFDDVNEILAGIAAGTTTAGAVNDKQSHRVSAATFGHNTTSTPVVSTHANFPLPPSSSLASTPTQTVFALSHPPSPDHLKTPVMPSMFPDSPVSPTFGSDGTVTNYRRASVKSGFKPSAERRDELRLDPGDRVNVVSVYEDGWAFVQRERNNERGLVPLTCLQLDDPQAM